MKVVTLCIWNYETYIGLTYFIIIIIIILWDGICVMIRFMSLWQQRGTQKKNTQKMYNQKKPLPSSFLINTDGVGLYFIFLPLFLCCFLFYFYFWFIDFVPVWILNKTWTHIHWTTFPRMVVFAGITRIYVVLYIFLLYLLYIDIYFCVLFLYL